MFGKQTPPRRRYRRDGNVIPDGLLRAPQAIYRGWRVNRYIDNDTAPDALIKGVSKMNLSHLLYAFIWELVGNLSDDIWIGRDGPKVTPSYLPTRHINMPFHTRVRGQFAQR